MKTRGKIAASAMALSLLGTATVASAAPSSEATPRRSVQLATTSGASPAQTSMLGAAASGRVAVDQGAENASSALLLRNRVRVRSTRPCVFRGRVTRCVVSVRRIEQRGRRAVAFGTITPRSNPGVHIPFHKRVVGVRTPAGIFGMANFQAAPTCAILSLVLGPLHLDILGLVIDLNRVVLNITGETGAGNLLGNLLCGLAGILDGGLVLGRFLSVLTELLAAINSVIAL
jgi:hypothetical protein